LSIPRLPAARRVKAIGATKNAIVQVEKGIAFDEHH